MTVTARRSVILVGSGVDLFGGAEVCLLSLARNLSARGWEVLVVLPAAGALSSTLAAAGIEVKTIDLGTLRNRGEIRSPVLLVRLASTLVGAVRLARLIRRRRPAVVHSNTSAVVAGALAARLARVPHVWHLREIYSGLPWAILGRLIPRLSVVVICISGAVAGRLRPGHGGRVVVIEDGVDIEFFSPGHGDHPDATVTMVARLHPLKGHRLFIEAAAQVASEEPRARFLVAGNIRPIWQPLLDDLHVRAQQLGVADRLEFLGHVDRAVLPALFARSTMAVVPSTWPEGGGLVVLEAMACGLPVIATNLGGPAEIITNGVDGILVSATDSGELATAISKLLSRAQLRRRLGTAGRKRVLSKYSEQVQADRVVGVYETVLEHRPAVSKAPDGRRTDPTDADR